jgi:cephalosporin-C deacetylase-like acetyl esterase
MNFDITDVAFRSRGARLAGRLVMPKGTGKVPVMILVHGSERDSARDFSPLQRMFPARGIGAFAYAISIRTKARIIRVNDRRRSRLGDAGKKARPSPDAIR